MSVKRFKFPGPKRLCGFKINTDSELRDWVSSLAEMLSDESIYHLANDDSFDFTYESFRVVDDRLHDEFPDGTDLSDPTLVPKLNWFAAYVGETFRRNLADSEWDTDRRPNSAVAGNAFVRGYNPSGERRSFDPWLLVENSIRKKILLAMHIPQQAPKHALKPNVYQLVVLPLDGYRLDREHVEETVESAVRLTEGAQLKTPEADCLRIEFKDAYLRVDIQKDDLLAEESKEIADMTGAPCGAAVDRITTCGYDRSLELLDSFTFITERLQSVGRYALFDPVDGELLFDV